MLLLFSIRNDHLFEKIAVHLVTGDVFRERL